MRKSKLPVLYLAFMKQSPPPSQVTIEYIVALRTEIDRLMLELTLLQNAKND